MTDQLSQLRQELSDRYAIERELGRGGMASVYLARDLKHDRPVAIKLLRPELALAVGAERFSREIKYAAALQHPHIVPVYDSGTINRQHYYVMPYVEGETLADHIAARGPLDPQEAIRIASDVCSALSYAHSRNVVHRDIKPANVMLSNGKALVMDFGVAVAVGDGGSDRITHTGVAVGTPAYMSPEQASGDGSVDGRSDIYSLGCVLFEMLSGESPYRGPTVQATLAQRFSDETPRLGPLRENLPPGLDECVARAMAKMPGDRYRSGDEFRKALDDVLRPKAAPAPFQGGKYVATVAVVVAAFASAVWVSRHTSGDLVIPEADVIAVVPFNSSGAGLDLLGEGMVDLLSTNLDGAGGIRTVDPRAVMDRWRRFSGGNGPTDLAETLRVGAELNAGAVLRGSVVEAGPAVRITAELTSVTGRSLARLQVDGPSDSVLTLVDNLSAQLLREIWSSGADVPRLRVSSLTTESLDAVRAYLRGEYHYSRSDWDSAAVYFERATSIDTTFALAFLRLTHTFGWLEGHGSPRALASLEAGRRFADRLPRRERSLMEARELLERGRPESVDLLRRYVARYPSDPEGWYELADAEYHAQSMLGVTDHEILDAFDHAIDLVPGMATALIHPVEISIATGDRDSFERYVGLLETAGDPAGANNFRQIGTAVWGEGAQADSAMEAVVRNQSDQLDLVFRAFFENGNGTPGRILGAFDRVLPGGGTNGLEIMKARFLSSLGRLDESREIIDSLFRENYPMVALASVYPVIAGYADIDFGQAGVAVLSVADPGNSVIAYLRAFYASRMNNAIGARTEIASARSTVGSTDSAAVDGLLTTAMGRVVLLEGDTLTGVEMMRDGMDEVGFSRGLSSFLGPARFELGLTLSRTASTRYEGINVLRYGMREELEYRAISGLAAARALENDGDVDGAIEEYNRFIRIWADADPELQPIVEEARLSLSRLVREAAT